MEMSPFLHRILGISMAFAPPGGPSLRGSPALPSAVAPSGRLLDPPGPVLVGGPGQRRAAEELPRQAQGAGNGNAFVASEVDVHSSYCAYM